MKKARDAETRARERPRRPPAIHPLTIERWNDLVALFGERGACGGCWCMWWRLARRAFENGKGAGNRRALRSIVAAGRVPGLIAYVDGTPAGWCSVAPREEYPVLSRSRVLAPVDELPVWSIVCFFIARPFRKTGLAGALIKGALAFAKRRGARIVEGYPVEPAATSYPDAFAYTGLASSFRRAGFVEVARRSATRPLMRHYLGRTETPTGSAGARARAGSARRS
jgi:GNAT superfamily N-acetyltransferase